MPADAATSSPSVTDLQRRIETLEAELRANSADREETRAREAALAEVLQAINTTSGDFGPVFNLILDKAVTLCDAPGGGLVTIANDHATALAFRNTPQALVDYWIKPQYIDPASSMAQALRQGRTLHLPDMANSEPYRKRLPMPVSGVELGGIRSAIMVPLLNESGVIGLFVIYRREVRPFTDRQIAVVEAFAAQALLAMQNARLLAEQREALEQQTATAEVLQVINSSPGNLQPVFDAIIAKAMTLCGAAFGMFGTFDGQRFNTVATRGVPAALAQYRASNPPDYGPGTGPGRLIAGEDVVHTADLAEGDLYRGGDPNRRAMVDLGGARTILNVALRKEGKLLGMIAIYRQEVRPFDDKQIALLQNFAAQAVIAMENARLLTEQREALEQQTATAEVLQVINSSPGDLVPVFDTVLEKAHALCGVAYGSLQLYDGEKFRAVAVHGLPQALADQLRAGYIPGPSHPVRPLLAGEDSVQIPDLASMGDAASPLRASGLRTALFVALRKDDVLLGQIVASRNEIRPFTEKETSLLQNFAQQAVIAIENARLLGELRESLDQQTAMADVLGLINGSGGDITPVFDAMVDKATALCDAPHGALLSWDGEYLRTVSTRHNPQDPSGFLGRPIPVNPQTMPQMLRVLHEGKTVQDPDLAQSQAYRDRVPLTVFSVEQVGIRTLLMVPLVSERGTVGLFSLYRLEVKPFTDKQIALIEAFAQQAVVAMENARLLGELTRREQELSVTFDHMGDGVLMLDADLRLAAWNRNFQRLLDVPDAFLSARPILDDYIRLLVERGEVGEGNVEAEIARYRSRAGTPWSTERTRADGRVVEVRSNPIPGGGSVVIYSNITERKKAEAEIAAARDTAEAALERQTATADILKVIASSPSDTRPAFEAIAQSANRLLGGLSTTVWRLEGEAYKLAAFTSTTPEADKALKAMASLPRAEGDTLAPPVGEAIRMVTDTETGPLFMRDIARLRGFRACMAASLTIQGTPIGFVNVTHREPGPFKPDDAQLLKTFADQAVIAIQNARLFSDLRDSLEQQTATADILRVISQSPTDVKPVLDVVVKAAQRFCGADDVVISLRDGDELAIVAHDGPIAPPPPRRRLDRGTAQGRAVIDAAAVHLPQIGRLDPAEWANLIELSARSGAGAALAAPLLREGVAVGAIILRRREVGPFTDRQIALLEAFAAQAVIAIENVRLFTELRESLEQQIATADILKVIAASPSDVQPVFDASAERSTRLVGGTATAVYGLVDDMVHLKSFTSVNVEADAALRALFPRSLSSPHMALVERAVRSGQVTQMIDAEDELDGDMLALARLRGWRSVILVPLIHAGIPIGIITVTRAERGAVAESHMELLKTFAAQAVIAIQNARLFNDLRESLEQQTAASEILQVISQSPTDVQPVLDVIAERAVKLCEGESSAVFRYDGTLQYFAAASSNNWADISPDAIRANYPRVPNRQTPTGLAMLNRMVVHSENVKEDGRFIVGPGHITATFRAALAVPMVRDDDVIGAIMVTRMEAKPFTERQIEFVGTFAAQAVIAIENVRLFTELRESLERLKAAQANLIQSEKMASLGQLTAGIAHEIKNPLNFVNNFAGLSSELLDELKQAVDAMIAEPNDDRRAELQDTMDLLTGNLAKIVEHGRRADGIVKSMLAHSRGGTGDWQTSNINGLVEEALNLAYHGARAQDQNFNVTLERDFGEALKPIDVVPQDVTRVFLNLIGNGFYATRKRQRDSGEDGYQPSLKVLTRDVGEAVEVRVRDNGIGISPEVRDKLFQPFFTTKPTGEGTGLGLSISYDIVTQQHGGTIEVESEVGQYTEFTVRLPRARRATA